MYRFVVSGDLIEERRRETGGLSTTEDFARAVVDAALYPHQETGATVFVGITD